MRVIKTNNEKSADLMLKLTGVKKPNCYECIFCRDIDPKHQFYRTCSSEVAMLIKKSRIPLEGVFGKDSRSPLFPTMHIPTADGAETLPSIIALEMGVNSGLVKWPTDFDPIYILFCMFFTTKEDLIQEDSDIDKK